MAFIFLAFLNLKSSDLYQLKGVRKLQGFLTCLRINCLHYPLFVLFCFLHVIALQK